MALDEYRRKRNFKATPEPAGGGRAGGRIFVVQLHHASHRHYDFRLELDGVLKSWAVPKGPSFDPKVKRLAMEVEDHPLSYAGFEGDIPAGNYGAGHVDIFDEGEWEPQGDPHAGLARGDLKFSLHGAILKGSWVLVRTRADKSGRNRWLLIKHQDEHAGPGEADDHVDPESDRPRPRSKHTPRGPAAARGEKLEHGPVDAELCQPVARPAAGDGWLHEAKWDGYRILATLVDGSARLWSRNGNDWTARLPAIARAVEQLDAKAAVLDGELLALGPERESFNLLQASLSSGDQEPLVYMLFDLLHLDGVALHGQPVIERKAALQALLARRTPPQLRYSEHTVGNGPAVFAQAHEHGLEGVVSKRVTSPYLGGRNGDWTKAKARPSDEFAVIGWSDPKGGRKGFGALLLAEPVGGHWRYIGRVGTGFDQQQLNELGKRLRKARAAEPPPGSEILSRRQLAEAHWIRPELVAEVFHQGRGGNGLLRQPAFKGLREDKDPARLLAGSGAPAPARVVLSHGERVVYPAFGGTKATVADWYRTAAPWLLPEIAGRPLAVLRCPRGAEEQCFFQKHLGQGWGEHVRGLDVGGKPGQLHLAIDDLAGLLELVQMNVIELHPWGSRGEDPDHADRIVFDLDPHPDVSWNRVRAGARELRRQLESIGLQSFLRTSGGKGLHVVVPIGPPAPWEPVKRFARAVASAMATLQPAEFVSVAGEANRSGRIFVDWLRNGRGATAIASYSLRARAGAGVAMPIGWGELGRVPGGDAFTLQNAAARLARRREDPWAGMASLQQGLPEL